MKKILSVILITVILFSFASCTAKPKETVIDINSVKSQITEKVELTDPLDIGTDALSDLYGIDSADVAESACLVTMDGTFPDEVIIVKAQDENSKQRIVDALNSRLSEVKTQSQNYDETNYKLAQECKVITEGNYVALFVSAHHAEMEEIFESAVQK